jgi:hypothetical protein
MTGRPQERRPVPAQHAGVGKTADDTIPASADVMTQTPDDLPHVPALQMLPHRIADISKQFVAGPGISRLDCPAFRDRQPAVNGQIGQERAGQADSDEGAAPDGNVPLVIQRGEQQHLCNQHNCTLVPAAALPGSPPPSRLGCRCVSCRRRPRMPTRASPYVTTGHGPAWTGTPPISSPLTSPGQLDSSAAGSASSLAVCDGQADCGPQGSRSDHQTLPPTASANRRSER